jgi:hypothetical protein
MFSFTVYVRFCFVSDVNAYNLKQAWGQLAEQATVKIVAAHWCLCTGFRSLAGFHALQNWKLERPFIISSIAF